MYLSYDFLLGSIAAGLDTNYVFNSFTMGTSGLPDIYTCSWLKHKGRRLKDVYIRQTMSAHGITNM